MVTRPQKMSPMVGPIQQAMHHPKMQIWIQVIVVTLIRFSISAEMVIGNFGGPGLPLAARFNAAATSFITSGDGLVRPSSPHGLTRTSVTIPLRITAVTSCWQHSVLR